MLGINLARITYFL